MSDLPSVKAILDYWEPRPDELYSKTGYLLDIGEPTCWACGDTFEGQFDCTERRSARWADSPLQRCHIVPRSLGGSVEPSNLVLMCATCHDLAPNTDAPEILFAWMRAQSKIKREFEPFRQAFADFGAPLTDLTADKAEELIQTLGSTEFRDWSKPRIGLHFKQTLEPGGTLSASSLIGLLLEYMRRHD